MLTKITLDKTGRVVLPKPLRDDMELLPGDVLEVESSEDEIILRPVRANASLHKKQGIWTYQVREPLSASVVQKTVAQLRREREEQVLGKNH